MEDGEGEEVGRSGEDKDGERVQGEVVADEPGEEGSAEGADGATPTDDGADGGGGEHVCHGGVEVGGPALMSGGGEGDEADGGPRAVGRDGVHVGHEDDGQDADGHEEQGEFAAGVDGMAALHDGSGERAAADAAYGRDGVDDDDGPVGGFEVEAV